MLNTDRIYNLLIKVLILSSKFILIIVLAKKLEAYELGLYGLIQSIIVYYMYFCGCDIYTYSTREYIKNKDEAILIKHAKTILFLSCLGLIFAVIFLEGMEGVFEYIPIILVLCIVEHYNQEVGRILIAKSHQLKAGFQLFIRTAVWCYIIAIISGLNLVDLNLHFVLVLWATFSFISLFYGLFILFKVTDINFERIVNVKLTTNWLAKALKASLVFFVGTLAVRTIFVLDKTYFEYNNQLKDMGVYVFYSSFAGVLLSFCDSAIFQFSYPKLISYRKDGLNKLMKNEMLRMLAQCSLIFILFSIASYLFLGYLIDYIGRNEYINNMNYFWWLLVINFILVCSTVFHYVIYAFNYDKSIMFISVISLLSFITILIMGYFYNVSVMQTVVFGVFVSTVITCVMKLMKLRSGFQRDF